MYDLNLHSSHISGGYSTNSTNPFGFSSLNANINGASSPPLSDYGSIAPRAMQSRPSSSLSLLVSYIFCISPPIYSIVQSSSLGLRRQSAGSGVDWRAGTTSVSFFNRLRTLYEVLSALREALRKNLLAYPQVLHFGYVKFRRQVIVIFLNKK